MYQTQHYCHLNYIDTCQGTCYQKTHNISVRIQVTLISVDTVTLISVDIVTLISVDTATQIFLDTVTLVCVEILE